MKHSKDRILVFASDLQLELLFDSDVLFMDGTFDTTPENFKQVYLIHAHKFGQGMLNTTLDSFKVHSLFV